MTEKPTDEQILSAVREWGGQSATYVVRNRLNSPRFGFKGVKTPWVLRQLKRLEKAGRVARVPSPYAVMLTWQAQPKDKIAS